MSIVFLVDAAIDILDAVCQIAAILDDFASDSLSQILDRNITSAHAVVAEPAILKSYNVALYRIEEIHVPAWQRRVVIHIVPVFMIPG